MRPTSVALGALLSCAVAATPVAGGEHILVKRRAGAAAAEIAGLHATLGAHVVRTFRSVPRLEVVALPAGRSVDGALAVYRADPSVAYAEPDYTLSAADAPDDPLYQRDYQWGLHNVGKARGKPGADIHAPDAWSVAHDASGIVVAVIDSGLRYTHEDLAANVWTNPGEIPGNGIDDDGDGYVDDVHGINAVNHDGDPKDLSGHGTAVAGVLGGVGDNRKGITGVAWRVQILPCRFLAGSTGHVSQALECIDFVLAKGARVINASWGSPDFSQALYDAIAAARDQGVPVVAAAGNFGRDIDARPFYPASFDLDNIVAVAATTRQDTLAPFSDYGATSVDIAAPGVAIVSTYATTDTKYVVLSGTSLATPYVTGSMALLMTRFPADGYLSLIQRLYRAVDPLPALAGKCTTGGRLDLATALGGRLSVASVSVPEGDSGTTDVAVDVTLAQPVVDTVTVDWSTANGSAQAGEDYVAASGTLTFPAGTTVETIHVAIVGDTLYAPDETFVVKLSNPVNAGLVEPEGRVTIVNDDPVPSVVFESLATVDAPEGSTVAIPVTLSAPAEASMLALVHACGGNATPFTDFAPVWGLATFPPHALRAEAMVTLVADHVPEPTESFFVDLGDSGSTCTLQKRIRILDGP